MWEALLLSMSWKTAILSWFFLDFLKNFVCNVQTFMEINQHPQAFLETPYTTCEMFEDFLKKWIFDYFFTSSDAPLM